MNRLADLNPAQREAVTTLSGPLLILAGAGTGKTRVITHRMAELIRRGIAPQRILSVTFTNKAAREMRQRTTELLGRRPRQTPWVSTFHALCMRILRQEIRALGYPPDFAIFDRGDQESLARSVLRDIRLSEKTLRPGDLLSRISRWKMADLTPSQAVDSVQNDLEFLASTAYRRYQAKLKASAAVDFDDLLMLTKQLFEEHPDVLRRYQERFDRVQIDEYQDTNLMQFRLAEALVRPHQNLCVVGDDDQSIYGWRGADVSHILDFQRHFPEAKVVRLQDNYRCTAGILELANRLVRHNAGRHEKVLLSHRQADQDVCFRQFANETEEAETVVREIQSLIEAKTFAPGEIAILVRTNEQPRLFESELRRIRLPYVLVGGQSFFDRKEIRDLLAYLKAIAHPGEETSLLRIINTPARGIGRATVEKLLARAVPGGISLWDALPQATAAGEITGKAAAALNAFHDLLGRYRREFQEQPRQMAETINALIEEIGYQREIERLYDDPQQRTVRQNLLQSLIDSAKQYLERTGEPSLAGFLEDIALSDRAEEADRENQASEDAVKLMTLHSAKGLEFPCVYLVGMEEGLLPHHRCLNGSDSAIAEERRLAYVGLTRAMDRLTLSRAEQRMKWGRRRPTVPSRFLHEMTDGETCDVEKQGS